MMIKLSLILERDLEVVSFMRNKAEKIKELLL